MTYDKPVTIQTMDDNEVWHDTFRVHARVNRISGNEYAAAGTEQAQNNVGFDIQYQSAINGLDPRTTRIVFRGDIYDISEPADNFMFKNRTLKFRAVMRVGR